MPAFSEAGSPVFLCFQSMTFNLKKDSNDKMGKSCSRPVLPALTDPPLHEPCSAASASCWALCLVVISLAVSPQRYQGQRQAWSTSPWCRSTSRCLWKVPGKCLRGVRCCGPASDLPQLWLYLASILPPLPCQQGIRVPVLGPGFRALHRLGPLSASSSQGSVPQVGAGGVALRLWGEHPRPSRDAPIGPVREAGGGEAAPATAGEG